MIWYVCSLVGMALLILLFIVLSGRIPSDHIWVFWTRALLSLYSQSPAYLIALLPYLAFLLIRYIWRGFSKAQWRGLGRRLIYAIVLPVAGIWLSLRIIDEYRTSEVFDYAWDSTVENNNEHIQDRYALDGKHRGMHVFGITSDATDLEVLKTNNVEWITFVPFINQDVYDKPPSPGFMDTMMVEDRLDQIRQFATKAKVYGFYTMLKPHIWLSTTPNGTWRSDIRMNSGEDWDEWFSYYENRMLAYARVAEELDIDLLCIGTELHQTVINQPGRWLRLIARIRAVYTGKLTYAANWSDDLDNIRIWHQLDYIGIQAYYPIADSNSPELAALEAGWHDYVAPLERLHQRYQKPILFTEIGYKSTTDAGVTPWTWERAYHRLYKRISHKTQALCYEAFFNVMWPQPWFAGAHLWQWQTGDRGHGINTLFTLKGKPALNVVARGFSDVVDP